MYTDSTDIDRCIRTYTRTYMHTYIPTYTQAETDRQTGKTDRHVCVCLCLEPAMHLCNIAHVWADVWIHILAGEHACIQVLDVFAV